LARCLRTLHSFILPFFACFCYYYWLPGVSAAVITEVLDFGIGTDPTEKARNVALVTGTLTVGIELAWYNIADFTVILGNALQGVAVVSTPVVIKTYQDMDNFNSDTTELHMTYYILPHGTSNAAKVLTSVNASRASTFEQYLAFQVKQDPRTDFIDTTTWSIEMPEPMLVTATSISIPKTMPDPPSDQTDALNEALENSGTSDVVRCAAAETGCLCAAMNGCLWEPNASEVFVCSDAEDEYAYTDVSCYYCSTQAKCSSDSTTTDEIESECGQEKAACSCAQSAADCYWNVSGKVCQARQVDYTSCEACADQDRCGPPTVSSTSPVSGGIVGIPARPKIALTFDRAVSFVGDGSSLYFKCWSDDEDIGYYTTSIALTMLQMQSATLYIDMSSLSNAVAVPCNLFIRSSTFVSEDGLYYEGMTSSNTFSFTWGDTVSPSAESFAPAMGEVFELDFPPTDLRIDFSESIRMTVLFEADLVAQHDSGSVILKSWSSPTDEFATTNGTQLVLDVADVTDWPTAGIKCALLLYEAAVSDSYGNTFSGLEDGEWYFSQSVEASTHVVSLKVAMVEVDGVLLLADATMLTKLVAAVQEVIASESGDSVETSNVQVDVDSSAVISIVVAVVSSTISQEVSNALLYSETIEEALVAKIVAVEGMSDISGNDVSVKISSIITRSGSATGRGVVSSGAQPCRYLHPLKGFIFVFVAALMR